MKVVLRRRRARCLSFFSLRPRALYPPAPLYSIPRAGIIRILSRIHVMRGGDSGALLGGERWADEGDQTRRRSGLSRLSGLSVARLRQTMLRPLLIAALLLIGLTVLGRSGGGGGPAPAASHLHARSHPSRFGGSVDTEAILQRWTAHHDSHLRRRSFNWFGLKKRDPEEERVIRLREAYAQRATEFMRMVLETNHGPGAPVPRKHIAKRQGSGNPVASMIASKATTAATNTNTATGLVTITAATKTSTSTLSAIPTDPPLSLPPGTFRNDYKDSYIYNPNTIRDPTWPLVPYASWNLTDALQRNYTCEINAPIEDFENREAFEVDSKNKVGGMNGGSGMLLSYVNGTTSFQGKLTDELGSSADVRGYFVRQLNYGNIQIDPTSKGVWLIYDEKAGNNMSNDSYANFVAWTSQLVWINLDQGRFDSITQNGSIVPYSSMDQTQLWVFLRMLGREVVLVFLVI